MRRYILDNTDHTRDLGGYPAENGKATKYGVFLRSAVPNHLSAQNSKLLADMNIRTIIDFRGAEEIERLPCFFADTEGFRYYNLPIRGSRFMRQGREAIPGAYMTMLESDVMPEIFKILAEPGGVLYHCTAGKDRTGVVSALLLNLAGVSDLDIIADYVMTYAYLVRLREIIPAGNEVDFPPYILRSDPEYISGFLQLFHEKYHDAREYLTGIGLTEAEIGALKAKLTV